MSATCVYARIYAACHTLRGYSARAGDKRKGGREEEKEKEVIGIGRRADKPHLSSLSLSLSLSLSPWDPYVVRLCDPLHQSVTARVRVIYIYLATRLDTEISLDANDARKEPIRVGRGGGRRFPFRRVYGRSENSRHPLAPESSRCAERSGTERPAYRDAVVRVCG